MRQNGFYWVRRTDKSRWEVAEFDGTDIADGLDLREAIDAAKEQQA